MRRRRVLGPVVAVAAVALTTAVLRACDADLTVAALVYIVVVVLSSLTGYAGLVIATVLAYACLRYWLTPHYGSFRLETADDFVAMITFALAASAAGFTVARVNRLRQVAEAHERAAFEAQLDAAINEGRAAFLSAMTHNLRTPLASIKTVVSTLQDDTIVLAEPDRDRLLVAAHDETERLDRLVVKVLELSRIHANAIEPKREPTDVSELTRGAVRRLSHVAGRDRVRLVLASDQVEADVDPDMIELVLVVLLENALRYSPRAGEVAVQVERQSAGCAIHVIDHGPGIAAADRARVFEEFVRLDGPADSNGVGLGLTIAEALVNAHGGTMEIEDTPGGGATFVVRLPSDVAS